MNTKLIKIAIGLLLLSLSFQSCGWLMRYKKKGKRKASESTLILQKSTMAELAIS